MTDASRLAILSDGDPVKRQLLRYSPFFQLIARLTGANFNTTSDQPFTFNIDSFRTYRPLVITVKGASVPLSAAQGGIYTGANKGGTAIVAATQAYSALTAANLCLDLTIATVPGNTVFPAGTNLYLSLTTGQGTPASADLYVYGPAF